MLDDLDNIGNYDISGVVNQQQQQPNNNYQNQGNSNGYQNNNNNNGNYQRQNNGNGGYQQQRYNNNNNQNRGNYNRGNGGGNFQRKEEVVEEPYIPVGFYVDETFPQDVKEKMYNLACKLINKNITVRVNGDDKAFVQRLTAVSTKFVEIYIPWKNFNDIDSKHSWNTLTATHIASANFGGWDKIPDSVKKFLARNVRIIFGDKNNSIVMALVTWSPDGASKLTEVSKETGRAQFTIKVAAAHGFTVINYGKSGAEFILEKHFNL